MIPPTTRVTFLHDQLDTPLGRAHVVFDDDDRLRAFDWDDCRTRMDLLLRRHYGPAAEARHPATMPAALRIALQAYFDGVPDALDGIDVATGGTAFQREVWAALRAIPAGTTVSYGELARRIGRPAAVRAVGAANGANPVGLVVPCHRVIGADDALTGYAGGLERKRWLLAHERAACALAA